MRALFFLVSFLWVLPSEYYTLNIPLPDALLIKGEPIGFGTPAHRVKRAEKDIVTVSCSSQDYKPRKRNYCCNKCLPGHRVANDCNAGNRTECVPCDSETYTDIPNNSKYCEACSTCLSQYGQITLSDCTPQKDTQCGCPPGHFKKFSGRDFICQECTTCQNGTQLLGCHDDRDTICKCFHNFFFSHSDNKCHPCSKCQEPDCKDHCPEPVRTKPEEGNVLLVVMILVLVVFSVAVVACVVYKYLPRKDSSSSDTSSNNVKTTLLVDSTEIPLEKHLNLEVNSFGVQQSTKEPADVSLPLPDITNGTAPPCLNSPPVAYAIIESIPTRRWKEFVRRLGLSNHTIESSEQDCKYYSEAQYVMLEFWFTQEGSFTSKRDQLFTVLQEMNLGGCIEKIEKHL